MIKNGTLVILIGTDGFMPPIGSYGEVVGFDTGDYEVLFPHHPCPVAEITWFVPPAFLLPVTPDAKLIKKEKQTCHT